MTMFSSFDDLLEYLNRQGVFHVRLGLERMQSALADCGLNELPFRMVQVLGTNGKGSTSTMLAQIAREHGLRTGLYTSPHFLCPTERIRIDGREVEREAWVSAANELMARAANARELSYFEFLTVLAILLFKEKQVQLAVLEAGLGGQNDATSALPVEMEIFTPIDIDHAAVIGPELKDIARDKAAAIRPHTLVCSAPQPPVAAKILEQAAAKAGIAIAWRETLPPDLHPGLSGAHQRGNAALALLAWRELARRHGWESSESAFIRAISRAHLPGRLQLVPGAQPILLDGAHNPHALRAVLPEAARILGPEPNILFSALADKDWPQMTEILAENFPKAKFFIARLANPRAGNPEEISSALNARLPGRARTAGTTDEALALAGGRPLLAIGSLYLLAEIYGIFPQWLENAE